MNIWPDDTPSAQAREQRRQRDCLGKLTWATRELAEAAVAYAGWQYGGQNGRPAPYRCEFCKQWHLARH